jgi:EAL and modified HD-GYP domain-containing signal transduction protein
MKSFIARQPIFDRNREVYGYEMQLRSGPMSLFAQSDQEGAGIVVNQSLLEDVQALSSGKRAFITATREVLLKDYAALLPREWLAIELRDSAEAGPELVAACRRLKDAGYTLVLGDCAEGRCLEGLAGSADIVRVDFSASAVERRRAFPRQSPPSTARSLATRVETREVFQEALNAGYDYFQGRFFCKPLALSTGSVPENKVNLLHMINALLSPNVEFEEVEKIIKRDVVLSYKLLQYVNSAFFGLGTKVKSVMHAMSLLGLYDVRRWATLLAMAGMANDKPNELLVLSLIRAKFCELLAARTALAKRSQSLYFAGMFSLVDAVVDRPIEQALEFLPMEEDVKAALLGEVNSVRRFLDYVMAYEVGDWDALADRGTGVVLPESESPELYLEAVQYAVRSIQAASGIV